MSVHGFTDDEYEASDDQPTLISKLDLSSPLHLHPNDSTTFTVVSVKLKSIENFQVWSCAMLLALKGKNKTIVYFIMSVHGFTNDEYEASDDQPTLISKLVLSSPLHFHSNDSATFTVVFVKLKGTENYQVWSCAMLLALKGKNKINFIDGSYRRSNTDEVLGRQYDRVNAIVLGWILNSISEELFLGQIFSKRAKHVWDKLKETYDKVYGSVTFNLHHKINSLSQNGSTIADYYHRLNALWKQFDALVQLPRCTCHAAEDFKKHNHLIKLMQFLMGLDDCYMQMRSNILSRDELPVVRSAYAIISSEESHRVVSSSGVGTSQRSQSSVFSSNVETRIMLRGLKLLLATSDLLM
ncbi:ribonuclease H-like domain-containing protein [Tanacetum coccineum]|uniref:Ribonuclease H-like domain-containing protein n=1 Tax=Tanacetum coccineum TaxID=301880 RepID=A0ABQ5G476_9ASTR